MNGYDVQLVAAILAAIFWNSTSVFLQKRWRVYDVFIGKKHALLVHGLLISFAWCQVLVVAIFVTRSTWIFDSIPSLGMLVFASAVWLFVMAVKDIGMGSLVNSNFFGRHLSTKSQLYEKLKHPIYLSYILMFVGIGISSGQFGYLLAAASLLIGLSLLAYIEKPVVAKNLHKHK